MKLEKECLENRVYWNIEIFLRKKKTINLLNIRLCITITQLTGNKHIHKYLLVCS